MATTLDIDTATYCKIEKGERRVKVEQVVVIAELLQTDKDCTTCGAKLRDKFQSKSFTKTFGELPIPSEIDRVYPFVQDYCCKRIMNKDGFVSLPTQNGSVDFIYHFFNTTYNAFVFLFPVGEKKSTRTKIIMSA